MTATLSFKIRTIKHQIRVCMEAVMNGLRSFVDRLIILEHQLERLMATTVQQQEQQKRTMKVQVKTGSESHTTNWRSAMVRVNGKPIYEVLKPISKPEWELVGNKGKHGKWCVAEYELPIGSRIEFTAKANSKEPIEFKFRVGEIQEVDVEGYLYNGDICGWIVSTN